MTTRPFSELRDSVTAEWDDHTREFHKKADAYFAEISRTQSEIGQSLANARVLRSLTQKQLEAISGVNQAEISRIESGQANPTEETLIKLTKAMNYRIELVPVDAPALA